MPKFVDIEVRKREFVAASWDLIAREGIGAATLRKVSAEAGCTTGALTHYFPDRNALLIETLRTAHFAAAERMLKAALAAETPFDRLRAIVLEAMPFDDIRLQEWRIWIAFWAATSESDELSQENARRYVEWRELIEETLSPLIADTSMLRHEVAMLMAHVDGASVRIALNSVPETIAAAQHTGLDALDHYLRLLQRRAAGSV